MITIKLASTLNRNEYRVANTTIINDFLEANAGNFENQVVSINGTVLQPGDFYKSFADFGIIAGANVRVYVQAPKTNA